MFPADKKRVRMDDEHDVLDKCEDFLALFNPPPRSRSPPSKFRRTTLSKWAVRELGMRACGRCGQLSGTLTKSQVRAALGNPFSETFTTAHGGVARLEETRVGEVMWWCASCEQAEPAAFECMDILQCSNNKLKDDIKIANLFADNRAAQLHALAAQVKEVHTDSDTYSDTEVYAQGVTSRYYYTAAASVLRRARGR